MTEPSSGEAAETPREPEAAETPGEPGAAQSDAPPAEERPFQAEVQKLLGLVINSLYAEKEVFLRELISNASDALDKARLYALTHEDARPQEGTPKIVIRLDEDARTLSIEDNGVGMTRDEAIESLGTIAHSGTASFLAAHAALMQKRDATEAERAHLIGQFGVGFYAAFMVASRVDVDTLSMQVGSEPVLWRSGGAGSFTVGRGERTEPGTRIVLHLKDEHRDFLRKWRVEAIIKRYSDFIPFPIELDGEVKNRATPLWALPKAQVTEEQHAELFHHVTGGDSGQKPLLHVHLSVDAPVQFQALIYVPERAPLDLFKKDRHGLRLYARRVLVIEHCDKLVPIWLRFLRGVVDSEDLSLNVSREMLQESHAVSQIEQQIVKQVLRTLKDTAESDPETYGRFWRELGKVLKEGITVDWKHKDAIAELCRFETMNKPADALSSLREYVDAMPEDQKEIYFVTGPSRLAVEHSPHLEAFRKKGYDVLLMTDPIDEWVVQALTEFDKRRLRSVAHGEVDLGEEGADATDGPSIVLSTVKGVLGDKVKDVRYGKRLVDSASVLVNDEGAAGANLERIMRMIDDRAQQSKRILELNPAHPIVKNLGALAEKEAGSERVTDYAATLYDLALLAEGVVEDPAALVARTQRLLVEVTGSAASAGAAAGGEVS